MAPSSSQKDVPEKAENAVAKGRIFSTTQAASMAIITAKSGNTAPTIQMMPHRRMPMPCIASAVSPAGGGIRKNAIAAITPSARQTMRFLLMLYLLTNPYRTAPSLCIEWISAFE